VAHGGGGPHRGGRAVADDERRREVGQLHSTSEAGEPGVAPKVGGYGEPYTGTKGETPETAKGEPEVSRAAGVGDGESVEGRRLAKGNTVEQNAPRTQSRIGASSALDRVREVAKKDRNAKFTALLHHVSVDRLRTAFFQLKRKAAAGVDGVTWEQYEQHLECNLRDLHARVHRGAYRPKPSRRVYIPKADGQQRPLWVSRHC
jgi:RNA-directed DNA polymerase